MGSGVMSSAMPDAGLLLSELTDAKATNLIGTTYLLGDTTLMTGQFSRKI